MRPKSRRDSVALAQAPRQSEFTATMGNPGCAQSLRVLSLAHQGEHEHAWSSCAPHSPRGVVMVRRIAGAVVLAIVGLLAMPSLAFAYPAPPMTPNPPTWSGTTTDTS